MTKTRLEDCPICHIETKHKIKNAFAAGKAGRGAILKYTTFHCLKCNRYYRRQGGKYTLVDSSGLGHQCK
jgi:hypothetical protein